MKLYTTGKGHWAGTQADARKLKKEHGVSCDMHEVPVAKQELLDFLNEHQVSIADVTPDEELTPVAVETVEEETKIVGETREQYMRKWRQEQADWKAESDVKIAIEDALWEAPFNDLSQYAAVVISRLGEVINEKEEYDYAEMINGEREDGDDTRKES